MAAVKTQVIVPSADHSATNLPFGVVSGEGVDNYSKDGKEYSVTIVLSKKVAKELQASVLEFWEANRGDAPKEPDNFKSLIKKNKAGETVVYVKSATRFPSGDTVEIALVDGKKNPLDPEQYGKFGGDSQGRVNVGLAIYPAEGTPKGVSRYIQAVQLTKFEKGGSNKTSGFGTEEGESITEHGFEDTPKKKKKKKNKNK